MSRSARTRGSVLLLVVFVIAVLSAAVMGMLETNTEEIQVMQNEVYAAEALATAEAGIEDALQCLRLDKNWNTGFSAKAFNGGTYTVTVTSHSTIDSVGTTARGYTAKVSADFTTSWILLAYAIKINTLRINE
jgi:type II secretory pathway component PulK